MPFGQGRSGGGGRGRDKDKKAGDKEKGQRRTLFRRRKVCKFCADKIDDINYKDVKLIGPFEPERSKFEAKEQEEKKFAEAVVERMANLEIEIARKVGETEALFGSVTSGDIAEALAKKGFDVDKRKLHLPEPIKKLGSFDVP